MIERMNGDSRNEVVTKTRIKLNIIPDHAGIQFGFVGKSECRCTRRRVYTHTYMTKLSAFTVTKSAY